MRLTERLTRLAPEWAARSSFSALASEIWLEEPRHVDALFAELSMRLGALDARTLRAFLEEEEEHDEDSEHRLQDQAEALPFRMRGDTAVLPIRGHILRRVPWYFAELGIEACGTEELAQSLLVADRSPRVASVELLIDSPGGTISGLEAAALTLASIQKPTSVRASGNCCSAAYWLASQAKSIVAEPGTVFGAIGVYSVIWDTSRAAETAGVKVHVIKSGEHKGVGEFGAPISEEQLKHLQLLVDAAAAKFKAAVQTGRGLSAAEVDGVATGECWFAERALELRLIDQIEPITNASASSVEPPQMGSSSMGTSAELDARKALEEKDKALEAARAEVEAAKAEAAKNAAKAAAADAALAAVREGAKTQAIDAAVRAGKVVPAMRASIDTFAAKASVEELEAFLATLPAQTRPQQIGATPAESNAREPRVLTADEEIAKRFGVTVAQMDAAAGIKQYHSDGTVVLTDGSQRSLAEVAN